MNEKNQPYWRKLALTPEQRLQAEIRGDLRMKTKGEIIADCKALDRSGKLPRAKRRKPVEKVYTDKERLQILSQIHNLIEKGVTSLDACAACNVSYDLFLQWRRRYKIKEPKLNGTGNSEANRRVAKGTKKTK